MSVYLGKNGKRVTRLVTATHATVAGLKRLRTWGTSCTWTVSFHLQLYLALCILRQ